MKASRIKLKIKIVFDVLMLALLIILMCEHSLSGLAHEIMGMILFFLFIIHNVFNDSWYKTMFKRRMNRKTVIVLIINLLMWISLIITLISSLMVSGYLFRGLFSNLKQAGRNMHMVSSMWLFLFISIHLGIHLNAILYKVKNKLLFRIFEAVIIIAGLFVSIFIDRIYEEMFLLASFKSIDEVPIYLDVLEKLSITFSIGFLTYETCNIKIRRKNNEKEM